MYAYQPPLEDFNFILHHFLKIEKENIRGYEDLLPEFTKTIFEEAGKLASEVISPSNKDGDEQGCILENGIVRTPDSFKLAFDQLRAGGWLSLDIEEEFGGQNLPLILSTVTNEMFTSANMSLTMYSGLSRGSIFCYFASRF